MKVHRQISLSHKVTETAIQLGTLWLSIVQPVCQFAAIPGAQVEYYKHYESVSTPMPLFNFADVMSITDCNLLSCTLLGSDCASSYVGTDLSIDMANLRMEAKVNERDGMTRNQCLQCQHTGFNDVNFVFSYTQYSECYLAMGHTSLPTVVDFYYETIGQKVVQTFSDFYTVNASLTASCPFDRCFLKKDYNAETGLCSGVTFNDEVYLGLNEELLDYISMTSNYTLFFCYKCRVSNDITGKYQNYGHPLTLTVTNCIPTVNTAFALNSIDYAANATQVSLIASSAEFVTPFHPGKCLVSCSLYQSGCAVAYTGSRLTLAADGALSAVQNDPAGYTESICIKCSSTGGSYSYEVTKELTVLQTTNNCTNALTPLNPQVLLQFESSSSSQVVISNSSVVFSNSKPDCSVTCSIFANDCLSALVTSYLTVNAEEVTAFTNQTGGYSITFCYQCATNEQTLNHIQTVTQNALDCSLFFVENATTPASIVWEYNHTQNYVIPSQSYFFYHTQNEAICKGTQQLEVRDPNTCGLAPHGMFSIGSAYPYPLELASGSENGWSSSKCIRVYYAAGFKERVITFTQNPMNCSFVLGHNPTPLANQTIPYLEGATAKYNFVNDYTSWFTTLIPSCVISCQFLAPGCQQLYTGTLITQGETYPGRIRASQNSMVGYTETICIECSTTTAVNMSLTYDFFSVTQTPMDCTPAVTLLSFADFTLDYLEQASFHDTGFGYSSFFQVDDPTQKQICVFTSCEVLDAACSSTADSSRLSIQESSPFNLLVNTSEKEGFTAGFCYRCTNSANQWFQQAFPTGVTVSPKDCTPQISAVETNRLTTVQYKQTSAKLNIIQGEWQSFFANADPEYCIISDCALMDLDCTNPYSGTILEFTDGQIKALQLSTKGYLNQACFKCNHNSGFVQFAPLVVKMNPLGTFTQTFLPLNKDVFITRATIDEFFNLQGAYTLNLCNFADCISSWEDKAKVRLVGGKTQEIAVNTQQPGFQGVNLYVQAVQNSYFVTKAIKVEVCGFEQLTLQNAGSQLLYEFIPVMPSEDADGASQEDQRESEFTLVYTMSVLVANIKSSSETCKPASFKLKSYSGSSLVDWDNPAVAYMDSMFNIYISSALGPGLNYYLVIEASSYSGLSKVTLPLSITEVIQEEELVEEEAEEEAQISEFTGIAIETKEPTDVKREKQQKVIINETVFDVKEEIRCWISSISSQGLVTIKFSEPMVDQSNGLSLETLDDSLLLIEVIPSYETLQVLPKYNEVLPSGQVQNLFFDFVWEPKSFIKDEIAIKLNFTYPLNVSQNSNRDFIQITIANTQDILRPSSLKEKQLAPSSLVMKGALQRMMLDDVMTHFLIQSQGDMSQTLNIVMITTAIQNLVLGASLVHLLSMINSLQVIIFQTMMNLIFPGNVQFFSKIIISILNAEILDPAWTTELVFDFQKDYMIVNAIDQLDIKTNLNDQIKELGFETFNPILNLGGLFIIIGTYFLQLLLYSALMLAIKAMNWQISSLNKQIQKREQETRPEDFEGGSRIQASSAQQKQLKKKRVKAIKNKIKTSIQKSFSLYNYKQAFLKRNQFEEAMEQKGVDLGTIDYVWKGPECDAETIEDEFTVTRRNDVTLGSTSLLIKPYKWSTKKQASMRSKLFFNEIITMSLESVIQLTMTGMLFITISQAVSNNFSIEQGRLTRYSSNITGTLSIIILLCMVSVSSVFLFLPEDFLKSRAFFQRISNLYSHLDLSNKLKKAQTLIFIVRRMNYCLLALSLQHIPGVQLIIIFLMNLAIMIYQGNVEPFKTKKNNNHELINEYFIGLTTITLFLYTDFCNDVDFKYASGYFFILIVVCNIMFNLYDILLGFFRNVSLFYRKKMNIRMLKQKKMKEEIEAEEKRERILELEEQYRNDPNVPIVLAKQKELNRDYIHMIPFTFRQDQFEPDSQLIKKIEMMKKDISSMENLLIQMRRQLVESRRQLLIKGKLCRALKIPRYEAQFILTECSDLYETEVVKLFYLYNAIAFHNHHFTNSFCLVKHNLYQKQMNQKGYIGTSQMLTHQQYVGKNEPELVKEYAPIINDFYDPANFSVKSKVHSSALQSELTLQHISKLQHVVYPQPHHYFKIMYSDEMVDISESDDFNFILQETDELMKRFELAKGFEELEELEEDNIFALQNPDYIQPQLKDHKFQAKRRFFIQLGMLYRQNREQILLEQFEQELKEAPRSNNARDKIQLIYQIQYHNCRQQLEDLVELHACLKIGLDTGQKAQTHSIIKDLCFPKYQTQIGLSEYKKKQMDLKLQKQSELNTLKITDF